MAGADTEGETPWASLCVCVCVGMVLEVGPGRPGWPPRAFLGIWDVGVKRGVKVALPVLWTPRRRDVD